MQVYGAVKVWRQLAREETVVARCTVERLVRQGYVERSRGTADRRVVLARITDAGRAVVEDATTALNRDVFERPGLPPHELRALSSLLTDLRGGLGEDL